MVDFIDIKNLFGIKKDIAMECDKDGNGKLEKTKDFDEISLFNQKMDDYKNKNLNKSSLFTAARDATYVADSPELAFIKENPPAQNIKLDLRKTINKDEICKKMHAKWKSNFPNSPLNLDFYNKVYDMVDTLNVTIPDSEFDKEKYSSKIEQTVDQVIAIFAGEAQLNPKAKKGRYNGLFQLATPGLVEAQKWAKKHNDVEGMNEINSNLTIEGFRKLSGTKQISYLVAYIGKCKEYSKIGKNQTITPAQLWSMIKYPFQGKNSHIIKIKNDSIKNVFKNNNIPPYDNA